MFVNLRCRLWLQLGKVGPGRYVRSVSSVPGKSTVSKNHYDIIIVGGGLIGTTLASALAKHKSLSEKSILLLEGAPQFKGFNAASEYSNRVFTLNNGTVELMKSIGAWEHITKARCCPVYDMQVWDASSNAYITFDCNKKQPIAHVVENDLVLDSVNKILANQPQVKVQYNSKIEEFKLASTEMDTSSVFLKSGEEYSCKMLIGADGANSAVRNAMNLSVFSINYQQMGIVATLMLDIADGQENHTAWQRFLPEGPVALLPLNKEKSSLVWTTTPEMTKKLLQIPSSAFVELLNHALSGRISQNAMVATVLNMTDSIVKIPKPCPKCLNEPPRVKGIVEESRAAFPLGFTHSASYVGHGVAIVGDAAHRIHPLAGQGVNLGYGDVACLVQKLGLAVYNGAPINSMTYLLEYERERLIQNLPIMLGVHGLQRLYNNEMPPVVLLRSLGLKLTNSIPFIKNAFINKAMS